MDESIKVTVNGQVILQLGAKADLDSDHIKVDGKLLHRPRRMLYLVLNKPKNCVTTISDPEGRDTVMLYFRGIRERVYPVGRLDYSSEGLLLLTNDGEFAHRITAPASHVQKTYVVKVNGNLTEFAFWGYGAITFKFDLGSAKIIRQARWRQDTSTTHTGLFQWQGSNDDASYTSIGGTFNLGGAPITHHDALLGNNAAYRYYRLIPTAGASISGTLGSSTTWMQPSGAPAATAASAIVRTASTHTRLAPGCGETTIALRVISASRTLK